jgi:UDP-3-O-[3-hydroxymyristoyl] N-acetylglucosamine deacetylase
VAFRQAPDKCVSIEAEPRAQGKSDVKQTTLADQVVIEGIGVHSGRPARVVLHPAEAGSGVTFLRTNLPNGRERLIEARNHAVRDTQLCTVIGDETGASIATIEHLMSALAGLGVDNVLVEVDGPEMPILDGSARLFVEAIDQVGLRTLSASRKVIKVLRPVRVEHGNSIVELLPRERGFRLDVEIVFESRVIGRQIYGFELDAHRYRREVASARTFGFMRDVERLWKAGLALGASLDNTVAVGEDAVVNPEGLRFPNEFVRHKLLDAIGDLSLAGTQLQGHYKALCPGHKLNVMVLDALFADRANYAITETAIRRPARGVGDVLQPLAAFAPELN